LTVCHELSKDPNFSSTKNTIVDEEFSMGDDFSIRGLGEVDIVGMTHKDV